jgi:hypothetical protein
MSWQKRRDEVTRGRIREESNMGLDLSNVDLTDLIGMFRERTPRLLVVTDGNVDAGTGEVGLSRFLLALVGAAGVHGMTPIVTHRRGDAGGNDAAFSDLATDVFDVLLLFGFDGEPDELGADALSRVARFMQEGGGVFATGDHEDLGCGMSGQIPPVRAMRDWAKAETPNIGSSTRLTTNLPGDDDVSRFEDPGDSHPQRLYANFSLPRDRPVFLSPFGPPAPQKLAHPLLRLSGGRILDVFPDHPHECRIPSDAEHRSRRDGAARALDLLARTIRRYWPAAHPTK